MGPAVGEAGRRTPYSWRLAEPWSVSLPQPVRREPRRLLRPLPLAEPPLGRRERLVASSRKLSRASARLRSSGGGGGGSKGRRSRGPARWTRLGSRARRREPGWRQRVVACLPGRAKARAATAPAGPRSKPPSTSGGTSITISTRSGSPRSASCTPIITCRHLHRRPRPSPSPSAHCSRRRPPCRRPRRRPGQLVVATPRAGPPAASGIVAIRTPSATCTVEPWTAPPTPWKPATGPA